MREVLYCEGPHEGDPPEAWKMGLCAGHYWYRRRNPHKPLRLLGVEGHGVRYTSRRERLVAAVCHLAYVVEEGLSEEESRAWDRLRKAWGHMRGWRTLRSRGEPDSATGGRETPAANGSRARSR